MVVVAWHAGDAGVLALVADVHDVQTQVLVEQCEEPSVLIFPSTCSLFLVAVFS